MKQTKKQPTHSHQLRLILVGAFCMLSAFAVGLQTNTSVTATLNAAESPVLTGDINGNDQLDIGDAIVILEATQGYRTIDPRFLKADPDNNGQLTIDDAIQILKQLQ